MKALHSFALAAALLVAAGSASAFSLEEAAQAAAAMAGSSGNASGGSNGNAASFPAGGAGGLAGLGALGGLGGGGAGNASALGLVNALGALNVTPQQAVGGTGALLSLAQNSLGNDQYSQLTGAVPGLDQFTGSNGLNQLGALGGLLGGGQQQQPVSAQTGTLLNNVSNLQQLNQAFSALGMQTGLVAQFAPILLQFLGAQGVGNSLLQNLSGAWGVPGALAPAAGFNVPATAGGGY